MWNHGFVFSLFSSLFFFFLSFYLFGMDEYSAFFSIATSIKKLLTSSVMYICTSRRES